MYDNVLFAYGKALGMGEKETTPLIFGSFEVSGNLREYHRVSQIDGRRFECMYSLNEYNNLVRREMNALSFTHFKICKDETGYPAGHKSGRVILLSNFLNLHGNDIVHQGIFISLYMSVLSERYHTLFYNNGVSTLQSASLIRRLQNMHSQRRYQQPFVNQSRS